MKSIIAGTIDLETGYAYEGFWFRDSLHDAMPTTGNMKGEEIYSYEEVNNRRSKRSCTSGDDDDCSSRETDAIDRSNTNKIEPTPVPLPIPIPPPPPPPPPYLPHPPWCHHTSRHQWGPCVPECFSGDSLVSIKSDDDTVSTIRMSALQVGDQVKTASTYEPVVAFLHAAAHPGQFISIEHSHGKLDLSPDHMIFKADGSAVAAKSIAVGDLLSAADSGVSRVEKISIVDTDSFYAPLTSSGTIVVDEIVSSCFVDAGWDQWVAQNFLAPVRWMAYMRDLLRQLLVPGASAPIYAPTAVIS